MDLWMMVRAVLRRFYVFVPVAFLTAVLAFTLSGTVAPEYTSSGSGILVGPRSATLGDGEEVELNPYLNLSSSMSIMAQVLQRVISGPATKAVIRSEGLSTKYVIAVERRSPIVSVTATSASAVVSRDTVARIVELMQRDLAERQGASAAQITLEPLAEPATALPSTKGAQRLRLMVLAGGLAVAVGAAVLVDTFGARRRAAALRSQVDADSGVTAEPVLPSAVREEVSVAR